MSRLIAAALAAEILVLAPIPVLIIAEDRQLREAEGAEARPAKSPQRAGAFGPALPEGVAPLLGGLGGMGAGLAAGMILDRSASGMGIGIAFAGAMLLGGLGLWGGNAYQAAHSA